MFCSSLSPFCSLSDLIMTSPTLGGSLFSPSFIFFLFFRLVAEKNYGTAGKSRKLLEPRNCVAL